jgi:citrate synthase
MTNDLAGRIVTSVAAATADTITVRGHDLVGELIGKVDVGALLYLQIVGRLPLAAEAQLMNAMIVAVAEHGLTPSAITARLTLYGAPESFQGAVAAGLLGVGDVILGPSGNVAHLLQVEAAAYDGDDDSRAEKIVEGYFSAKRRIPGLGHPQHEVDPRAERLLAMQRELGGPRRHSDLMEAIHRRACARRGKHLTFNAVAAIGAIASDLGIDWRAVRGIGLVARAVGLVGHLLEEMDHPAGGTIWRLVEENADYSDPPRG